jgi:hypothetical protein
LPYCCFLLALHGYIVRPRNMRARPKNLRALEFLDFNLTSYKGDLEPLNNLAQLKAVTLPRVSTANMMAFKPAHPGCVVVNEYAF